MNPYTPTSKCIQNLKIVHWYIIVFPHKSGNRLSRSSALPKNNFRSIDLKDLIRFSCLIGPPAPKLVHSSLIKYMFGSRLNLFSLSF